MKRIIGWTLLSIPFAILLSATVIMVDYHPEGRQD